MPKSVFSYVLDKVRYLDLEIAVNPVLFSQIKEADGRDIVKYKSQSITLTKLAHSITQPLTPLLLYKRGLR